jgi:hypothetical protein
MFKAGNPRESDDATGVRRFDSPRDWRVSVERHVRAVLVVVSGVRSNQSQQVALAKDDDTVEYLTPERTDEPLRVSVLPGRPGRGLDLADADSPMASPAGGSGRGCGRRRGRARLLPGARGRPPRTARSRKAASSGDCVVSVGPNAPRGFWPRATHCSAGALADIEGPPSRHVRCCFARTCVF